MNLENFDKKYLKIALYVIFTIIIIKIFDMFLGYTPGLVSGCLKFLKRAYTLFIPVIIAMCIAYILSGPTNSLTKLFMKKCHIKNKSLAKGLAITITYLCTLGVLIGILLGIYYMIGGQLSKNTSVTAIYEYITSYIATGKFDEQKLISQIENLNLPFFNSISGNISTLISYFQNIFTSLLTGLSQSLLSLGSNLFSILIAFIISIYLLFSSDYFIEAYHKVFYIIFKDSKFGRGIKSILGVFNYTFSNYIRGQLIEAFFVAVLISVVLLIVGVDYALVIGIITGILNLIPYLGAFIGVILATLMGLFTGGPWMAVAAFICAEGVQQVDANFLCPRIVGDKVGIHPAFILIAITIGGSQWGLLGMILAVPVTASLITIIRIWYRKNYLKNYSEYKLKKEETIEHMIQNSSKPLDASNESTNEKKSSKVKAFTNDIKDIMGDGSDDSNK